MAAHKRQRGQAIVLVALMMVAIFALAAWIFDAGLAMSDRRNLQADADSAALAGARSYPQGVSQAHWVAVQYLAANLGLALPLGACSSSTSCPAGNYTSGAYSVTLADAPGRALDVSIQHTQPSIFGRVVGVNSLVSGTSGRATPVGPVTVGSLYALAAVSGDALIHGGGTSSPTGNVSGPVYAYGSFGSNNNPHAPDLPATQTNFDGSACAGAPQNHVDNGGGGNSLAYNFQGGVGGTNSGVAPPTVFDTSGPTTSGPTYTSTAAATGSDGNWQPGIYDGIFPSGGKLDPGIYKIINVSSTISLGNITNAVYTASGSEDTNGAVAIVLDSSDTGSLDISSAKLNGLDDLRPQNWIGPRDPEKTHNFLLFSTSGATGYSGGITIGPHASTDMSGIIYLPKSTVTFNGNSSPQFTGSVIVGTLTINGGGNGTQQFNWVCDLNSIAGTPYQGGLVR